MKFGPVPLEEAAGCILAHKTRLPDRVLKKGHVLSERDCRDLVLMEEKSIVAARLETAGTPSEILISYETYAHVKEQIHCEPQGKLTVKGVAKPVATYKVIADKPLRFPQRQLRWSIHPRRLASLPAWALLAT